MTALASIFDHLGIDSGQYRVIVGLFRKLSDRQEFEVGNGQMSRNIMVGLFSLAVALLNLVEVASSAPLSTVVAINCSLTAVLLLLTLLSETVNTFLNPVEASVLAYQPISERTYFAAKLSYLFGCVAVVVVPLNLIPAVAGLALKESRWFFPATYMAAVYAMGLFVALSVCSIIGLLFRLCHYNDCAASPQRHR